jgi:alpha-amylase
MWTERWNDRKNGWALVVPGPARERFVGTGYDILLQGFHWNSHRGCTESNGKKRSWYRILEDNAAHIRETGFTWVWFPPSSDSASADGYIPRRWNQLNTPYGSEAELRSVLTALQPVKAAADVVLNHRVGSWTGGHDFEDPPFPDNRAAVACNDRSGCGCGQPDTSEALFEAGRELDHSNPGVRDTIKAYLGKLKSLGFRGFRYDLVKGFSPRYIAEYNEATEPELTVGEFFDGDRQKITHWIDGSGGRCSAFDFPSRFLLYDACMSDEFSRLRSINYGRAVPGGLIGYWPARAVTFVDNHDTEPCRDEEHMHKNENIRHFPGRVVPMAYSYILLHPGTPCVFWPHFFDWGQPIRTMIERLVAVRKSAGIHARSAVDIREARSGLYAAVIDGKVAVKLGTKSWSPGGDWKLLLDGERCAVWGRGE